MGWQKATGYGRRCLVDAAIGRYKHLIGSTLRAGSLAGQQGEVAVAGRALNRTIDVGKPLAEVNPPAKGPPAEPYVPGCRLGSRHIIHRFRRALTASMQQRLVASLSSGRNGGCCQPCMRFSLWRTAMGLCATLDGKRRAICSIMAPAVPTPTPVSLAIPAGGILLNPSYLTPNPILDLQSVSRYGKYAQLQ